MKAIAMIHHYIDLYRARLIEVVSEKGGTSARNATNLIKPEEAM